MAGSRARILSDAEAVAEDYELDAGRHDARARTAEKGYLLHTSDDARDPSYAMGNQSLISAAGQHGLLRSDPL